MSAKPYYFAGKPLNERAEGYREGFDAGFNLAVSMAEQILLSKIQPDVFQSFFQVDCKLLPNEAIAEWEAKIKGDAK